MKGLCYIDVAGGERSLETEELLGLALDIGEEMLISGAEVGRVEDSVRRILTTYDVQRADVFTITSSIVVTVTDAKGKTLTQTRRIRKYATNLDKLHSLNALSRKICAEKPDSKAIRGELSKIHTGKTYPVPVLCAAFALIAGSFTLFFGGTALDAAAAALIGAILKFSVLLIDKTGVNMVFANVVNSFLVSALAFLCTSVGFGTHADSIIIGNIMLLIPGIGMTNAIRDIISGDIMAGILRFCESVVIAIAIAAGYSIAALLFGRWSL